MGEQACVQGVIAVIEHDGKILMIRRAAGIAAGGCWCFPGGAIEAGEKPAEALIREVQEEVGLDVEPLRQVWEWHRPDGRLHLLWWLARPVSPGQALRPAPAEVAEARWLEPGTVRGLTPILSNNLEFLDVYESLCRAAELRIDHPLADD